MIRRLFALLCLNLCILTAYSTADSLPNAIQSATERLSLSIPKGTRIAVIHCSAPTSRLADYVVSEVAFSLVSLSDYAVIERKEISLVMDELEYQMSGDVSDESAQSIGNILGAQVIISCHLDEAMTLRLKAIEVETARIVAVSQANVSADGIFESLSRKLILVSQTELNGADAPLGKAVEGMLLSTVSGASGYRAVSPETRERALGSSAVGLTDLANRATRARIASLTEADAILLSTITKNAGVFLLNINLVDATSGTVISGTTETYRSGGTVSEGAASQARRVLGLVDDATDARTIVVSNMTELLAAIGSDRVIRLKPGIYDISKGYDVKNRSVSWVDEYDGLCPIVKSVSNLSIVGGGEATIVITPKYGWVFSFETCSDVQLSGITFGHTEQGYCLGGVLRFRNCEGIDVSDCDLYGCGTYGVGIERSERITIERSIIRDCSYGLAQIFSSSDIVFIDTVFRDTGEYDLIEIKNSDHVTWRSCEFIGNWGSSLFNVDSDCRDIRAEDCLFTENTTDKLSVRDEHPYLVAPRFRNNENF